MYPRVRTICPSPMLAPLTLGREHSGNRRWRATRRERARGTQRGALPPRADRVWRLRARFVLIGQQAAPGLTSGTRRKRRYQTPAPRMRWRMFSCCAGLYVHPVPNCTSFASDGISSTHLETNGFHQDIARAAQVSHSTVSRALRDSPLVNPETRELIRKIAAEQGYTVSAVARSLVTRRTNTRGRGHQHRRPVRRRSGRRHRGVCHSRGYSVILATCHGDPEREQRAVRSFQERRVDGILVTASRVGALYMPCSRNAGAHRADQQPAPRRVRLPRQYR